MRMIHRTEGKWEIELFDQEAEEAKRLFGTSVLPAPYTPSTPLSEVIAGQRMLDPETIPCGCAAERRYE